jgi:methylglutamate dehydrogenase subunit C
MNEPGLAGQPHRLAAGGLIDRSRLLPFQFDAVRYAGFAGDTLASALLAAGVRLVGRSFKYHRPRGILTAGPEEPNALVELRGGARREPNTRATVAELFDGLEARSQNRWPSLAFDVGAVSTLFSPIFVAGFYYKTFMWPAALWERLYEPAIRRAAGLGRATHEPDPDIYEKAYAFCDVLIIGAGAAGLAAALAAASTGARVILCDEDFVLGGRLNAERHEIDGRAGQHWARGAEAELLAHPEVRILRRTTVFGMYDGGLSGARTFGALERVSDHLPIPPAHQPRQRFWRLIAKQAVLASGALERPIVFGGNDRPGVMMASAVRTFVNRFGVAPGRRAALFTTSDDGWRTAFDLAAAGVSVSAVIDARSVVAPELLKGAARLDTRVFCGAQVVATRGARALERITVRDLAGQLAHLPVDTLAVSGGWNPSIGLCTHIGGRPRWSQEIAAFVPGDVPRGMAVAGAARGAFALADALQDGAAAGAEAARALGLGPARPIGARASDESTAVWPLWCVSESRGKSFVDFQNDVTREDVALAAREGFRSVELLKRYTTLGMATDQGRSSSINGHAILAALTGHAIPELGTTTSRPPYTPVAVGALAGTHRGKHFKPTRLTAAHGWAQQCGASFMEAGEWLRAQWFARAGENDWLTTVVREVRAVRSGVGVCDVSTLGKIDIQGRDAAVFLDRVYINLFSSLPVGKVRYGFMLREDGLVMDDGTSARLGAQHFLMSTTTANAAKVMRHLEFARQLLWPTLDVQLCSVSEQWAQFAIAGPKARQLLERLLGDALDISHSAFPYLACAAFAWRGVPARLFRISFSGELAYELAVPARYGDATIRAIMDAGESFGITPYGIEALNIMRIEKGHVTGNEINGTTTAADLGFGAMMSRNKDFIGRVLARRPGLAQPDRPALVGIKPIDKSARLYSGAHFLTLGALPTLENDQGYVTSVAFSPMLGHWIGLGLLARGRERLRERIRTHSPVRGGDTEVEVVAPVFYDAEGTRLKS